MAKKIKEQIEEAVEEVVDKIEEVADEIAEVATETFEEVKEEVVDAVEKLAEGVSVEVVGFYVRALNGLKGLVKGKDDNGNVLIELEGGNLASFKGENLKVQ